MLPEQQLYKTIKDWVDKYTLDIDEITIYELIEQIQDLDEELDFEEE